MNAGILVWVPISCSGAINNSFFGEGTTKSSKACCSTYNQFCHQHIIYQFADGQCWKPANLPSTLNYLIVYYNINIIVVAKKYFFEKVIFFVFPST